MMNIPLHPHLRQTDVSSSPSIRLLNADCVEVMKTFEDKQFDFVALEKSYLHKNIDLLVGLITHKY